MGSNATVTVSKMELTPMRVKLAGVDLGGTLGNVQVEIKYTKSDIKADQLGVSAIDRKVTGFEAKVTFEVAEITDHANWKKVFPHATLIDADPDFALQFNANLGDNDQDHAVAMLLHPLSLDDADLSGDIHAPKAVSSAESQIVYGPGEQARLKVVLMLLPDLSTTPARYMTYGDPDLEPA